MKKFLIFMFFIMFSTAYAQNFFEVEWSEFCPPRYANIDPNQSYFTGAARYWANRRKIFNNRVATCRSITQPDMRYSCFEQIRNIETQATDAYTEQRQKEKLIELLQTSL